MSQDGFDFIDLFTILDFWRRKCEVLAVNFVFDVGFKLYFTLLHLFQWDSGDSGEIPEILEIMVGFGVLVGLLLL